MFSVCSRLAGSARSHVRAGGSWKSTSWPALRTNIDLLQRQLAPGTEMCLVLKADAYGHGLAAVFDCPAVRAVASVAVLDLDEAITITGRGPTVRCLAPIAEAASLPSIEHLDAAIQAGVILSPTTKEGLKCIERCAAAMEIPARIDWMIDTGMHREGVAPGEFPRLLAGSLRARWIQVESVSTHFCDADSSEMVCARAQLEQFRRAVPERLAIPRIAANTAALLRMPESHFEMVRPGLGVFGVLPIEHDLRKDLRPVLKWQTRVVKITPVHSGESAGYGPHWCASHDTHVATLPVGYSDGYDRRLANRGQVLIRGRAHRVVGAVSMNFITVDLGPCPIIEVGEPVLLLDDSPTSPASVYAWAEQLETIPYEILTSVGAGAPIEVMDDTEYEVSR